MAGEVDPRSEEELPALMFPPDPQDRRGAAARTWAPGTWTREWRARPCRSMRGAQTPGAGTRTQASRARPCHGADTGLQDVDARGHDSSMGRGGDTMVDQAGMATRWQEAVQWRVETPAAARWQDGADDQDAQPKHKIRFLSMTSRAHVSVTNLGVRLRRPAEVERIF
jgi:hypothetical protein